MELRGAVLTWYEANARNLPWRAANATAWSVLVSEIMLQQTPVVRVAPVWRAWMRRWPNPVDLAEASTADLLRAWDRLGYPRRALRLREAARVIVEQHGGQVPDCEQDLLALPGIGSYTAAAVVAFAYQQRSVVLDTNVRRVLGRALTGTALPPPSVRRQETELAASLLPTDAAESARWNVAVMELGALVCTARSPSCQVCPVADSCRWRAAGYPADEHAARRRSQAWHGTDRQARGRVLAALRGQPELLPDEIATLWGPEPPMERIVRGLVDDELLVAVTDLDGIVTGYRLPES